MKLNKFFFLTLLTTTSCTHLRESQADKPAKWTEDVRMAQAQVTAAEGTPIQGEVNFEQMPNSVIVTYRIEGLKPRSTYQIFLHENQSCDSIDMAKASPLMRLRTNSDGIAENTFKNVDISVSGKQSLAGDSIVIRMTPIDGRSDVSTQVACGEVLPQNPNMAAQ